MITDVWDASWTDDSRSLLLVTSEGAVFEIDSLTGEHLGPAFPDQGNTPSIISAGPYVRFSSPDGGTRLFDLAGRVQLGTDFVASGERNILARSLLDPSGRHLFIPGGLGVEIWDLVPDHWRDVACRLAGRNLTRAEWRTYMPDGMPYRKTCTRWPLVN